MVSRGTRVPGEQTTVRIDGSRCLEYNLHTDILVEWAAGSALYWVWGKDGIIRSHERSFSARYPEKSVVPEVIGKEGTQVGPGCLLVEREGRPSFVQILPFWAHESGLSYR